MDKDFLKKEIKYINDKKEYLDKYEEEYFNDDEKENIDYLSLTDQEKLLFLDSLGSEYNQLLYFENEYFKKQEDFESYVKSQNIKKFVYEKTLIANAKKKILGIEIYKSFKSLFNRICDLNNKHINKNIYELKVELNTSKEANLLRTDLNELGELYSIKRLEESKLKESNFNKFLRIKTEFLQSIRKFTYQENTILHMFLFEFEKVIRKYLISEIYDVRIDIRLSRQLNKLEKINDEDSDELKRAKFFFKMTNTRSQIQEILSFEEYDLSNYSNDINTLKESIQILADNIVEIKPFIFRDNIENMYKSINIIENKLSLRWFWKHSNGIIGNITGFKFDQTIVRGASLSIDLYGMLVEPSNSFLTTQKVYEDTKDINVFKINLYILEKFHDYLYSLYEKEDLSLNAIETYIGKDVKSENDDLKAMSIISTSLSEKLYKPSKSYNIRRNTTWQKFIKILVENFNCVVDYQGKGDDIKIYRKCEDTTMYRTSDPKTKKREILVKTQVNILKKIGINIEEWIEFNRKTNV